MPSSQPFGVSCKGGLNTNLNQFEILSTPGAAETLQNFEVDPDGGYRRINGFKQLGRVDSNPIKGIFVYADGIIFGSGTNLYFTKDFTTYITINRDSANSTTGDNYTTFNNQSVNTRTNQGDLDFTFFEDNTDYGKVIISDGVHKPVLFFMTGTAADVTTRTFLSKQLVIDSNKTPAVGTFHTTRFVAGGDPNSPNTVYYSSAGDLGNYATGINLDDQIVGLKSFRDDIIIFCRNSIHKLININDSNNIAIVPITKNVGCIAKHSIQEIGGDLVFMSPDGIRTVAGTARIGDVELSSVSRQIQSIVASIAAEINTFRITSCVLRNKSQYRLFYSSVNSAPTEARGIIGTLTERGFEWSETRGIQALGLDSGFGSTNVEIAYHGDRNGYIYQHDSGSSMSAQGSTYNIEATYITPHFDFGDLGTRKTLEYVRISLSPEGTVAPTLTVRYNREDGVTPQPAPYQLSAATLGGIFGLSSFGDALFGAAQDPTVKQLVQGSGHAVNFKIASNDQKASYSINGLYINYIPSSRR